MAKLGDKNARLLVPGNVMKRLAQLERELDSLKRRKNPVRSLDELSNNLGLMQAGEFRAGNGLAPGGGFTGTRMVYPGVDSAGTAAGDYALASWNNDVLQVGWSYVDGLFYFGAGAGWASADGLVFVADSSGLPDPGNANTVQWQYGAHTPMYFGAAYSAAGNEVIGALNVNGNADEQGAEFQAQASDSSGTNAATLTLYSLFGSPSQAILTADEIELNGALISGSILAGTYTPTLTDGTNVAASTSAPFNYIRVGTIVFVTGRVGVDTTATGAYALGISLPIASDFAAVSNAQGVSGAEAVTESGTIVADITNDRVTLNSIAVTTANHGVSVSFSYRIL